MTLTPMCVVAVVATLAMCLAAAGRVASPTDTPAAGWPEAMPGSRSRESTASDGRDDVVHVRWVRPAGARARPVVVEPSPYFAGGNDVRNHDVDVPRYVPKDPLSTYYDYLYRRRGHAYLQADSLSSGGSTTRTGSPAT